MGLFPLGIYPGVKLTVNVVVLLLLVCLFCFVLFPIDVTIEERFLSEISNGSAQTQGESWRLIRMQVDNKLLRKGGGPKMAEE